MLVKARSQIYETTYSNKHDAKQSGISFSYTAAVVLSARIVCPK